MSQIRDDLSLGGPGVLAVFSPSAAFSAARETVTMNKSPSNEMLQRC
jgi:hypothetical protein